MTRPVSPRTASDHNRTVPHGTSVAGHYFPGGQRDRDTQLWTVAGDLTAGGSNARL